jgi:hypothetical protein
VDREAVLKLLVRWQVRSAVALFAYNRAANRCRTWDSRIGFVVAALTALIGTSVFATLQEDVSTQARIAVGLVSVVAAIFSSVQAFAGLGQRTEEYERAARRYGTVRRRLEIAQQSVPAQEPELSRFLDELRQELDAAAENSPNAPARVRNKVRAEMEGEFPWWTRLGRKLRGLPPPAKLGPGEVKDREETGPLTGA